MDSKTWKNGLPHKIEIIVWKMGDIKGGWNAGRRFFRRIIGK